MAQQRLAMRKIKDLLRLHLLGGVGSCRQLARAAGCGKTAVSDCLRRAAVAGLRDWEAVEPLDEDEPPMATQNPPLVATSNSSS
jgi:hypothetical protein